MNVEMKTNQEEEDKRIKKRMINGGVDDILHQDLVDAGKDDKDKLLQTTSSNLAIKRFDATNNNMNPTPRRVIMNLQYAPPISTGSKLESRESAPSPDIDIIKQQLIRIHANPMQRSNRVISRLVYSPPPQDK